MTASRGCAGFEICAQAARGQPEPFRPAIPSVPAGRLSRAISRTYPARFHCRVSATAYSEISGCSTSTSAVAPAYFPTCRPSTTDCTPSTARTAFRAVSFSESFCTLPSRCTTPFSVRTRIPLGLSTFEARSSAFTFIVMALSLSFVEDSADGADFPIAVELSFGTVRLLGASGSPGVPGALFMGGAPSVAASILPTSPLAAALPEAASNPTTLASHIFWIDFIKCLLLVLLRVGGS